MLDRSQIIAHGKRIVAIEFELRHVRVAAGNAAFELLRKLIEIKGSPKRAERWRAFVPAASRFANRMASRAEFPDKNTPATRWILRLSCAGAYCKYSEKP